MRRLGLVFVILVMAGSAAAQSGPVLRSHYSSDPMIAGIQWSTLPGVNWYQVRRTYTFPNNWYVHPALVPASLHGYSEWFNGAQNTVVYQVIPVDANGVQVAPASNYAMVSKYSYATPIIAGQTVVSTSFITELRTIVTNIRATMGLAAPSWTRPTLTAGMLVLGVDVDDVRTGVNGITSLLGLSNPPYAQASPLAGKPIKKVDIQQLRDILRSYPEMYWPFPAALDPYFSPNGDGVKDTTTFSSDVSWSHGSTRTDFRWQIFVRNASNVVLRTATGTSPVLRIGNDSPRVIHTWIWDGRDGAGTIQPDGVYTYEIIDLDTISGPIPGNWGTATVTLDTTPPSATISSPADPYILSNVRLNGGGSVTVTGSVSDAQSFDTWKLERIGSSQTVQLNAGTTAVTNGTLGTMQTIADNAPTIPNGAYQLKLTATDKAGNSTVDTNAVTVGHFSASQNVYQIRAIDNQTVTYTSNVPFTVNETVEIRNASNTVIRTLFSGSRAAGAHQDIWNGRNDANQLAGDGPHYFVATVTEGASSMTWDPRTSYVGGHSATQYNYPLCSVLGTSSWVSCGDTSLDFDPFGLKPLTLSYCVGGNDAANCSASTMPAWVIGKVTNVAETDASCSPYCIFTEYQPGGPQTFAWFGTSVTGSYVAPYYNRLTVIRRFDQIPRNMVLVYGTKPSISNLRIAPLFYNPGAGTTANGSQTFTVNVDTYLGRQAQLQLQFRNMSSNSILRTLTTPLTAEGDISAVWNGRADNNAWVAPGWYEVTITAIDSAGSTAKISPIVVVRY